MSATGGEFAMFEKWVRIYAEHHPKQRAGQAAWNALRLWNGPLAEQVTKDGEVDPFHYDARLPAFRRFVHARMRVSA